MTPDRPQAYPRCRRNKPRRVFVFPLFRPCLVAGPLHFLELYMTHSPLIAELNAALLSAYRRLGGGIRVQASEGKRLLDISVPTTVPVSDDQLLALGAVVWPLVLEGIAQTRLAVADRKLSLIEVSALGTTLLGIISKAVVAGAPLVQDGNAECLVGLVFKAVCGRFVVPRLPLWARPLAPLVYAAVVRVLEESYRAVVKPRMHPIEHVL